MFGAYLSDGFGSTVIWKPISAVSSENFETAFEPYFFLHLNRKISKEMTLGVYGLWKNLVLSSWCGDYSDWPVYFSVDCKRTVMFFSAENAKFDLVDISKKTEFFWAWSTWDEENIPKVRLKIGSLPLKLQYLHCDIQEWQALCKHLKTASNFFLINGNIQALNSC